MQWFGVLVEKASGMSSMRLHSGHWDRVLFFLVFAVV